ncbi:hypothetical protein [Thiothrix nivea]|uniref:Uncharacterized protein n=1 Tax=Thiothrix nivea (strain ATCC 35100 / DSM 5205 / JP2) TaxID=870187 RepID=A0A656HFT1_THINJ|nr:hypothetical protein [Thiothrix nivea]EIJ35233.1 hypothetical protein Thini_2696 [Thiothrix nivea DSM 5205]
MDTVIRNTIFATAALLMAASSTVSAGDFDYIGKGGWRDMHGGYGDSKDKQVHNLGQCQDYCKSDSECTGVEYRTHTDNHHNTYHVCEIHHDEYGHCDTSGGSSLSGEDGCYVRHADPDKPKETNGRDPDNYDQCYAQHWNWITFGNYNQPEVHVDPYDHGKLKAYHTGYDNGFEVTVHHDCTISLKSRYNHKYVSNWEHEYNLKADGNHIGKEDQYKVYKDEYSGRYLFKSVKHGSWVYTDHQGYVKSDPHGQSTWEDRKYHVNIN